MGTLALMVDAALRDPAFRAGLALALVIAMVLVALVATSPPGR
jgi:hypothetical protein